MQNNRKRNVIKERIRQEKERRERLLAEEEEQYEDIYKDPISEQIQKEHLEQPQNQREESVNVNLPKNESSNSNPALDWITTIQKQAGTSENDLKIEETEEEAREREEEEARKQAEAEARRKVEAEARKLEEVEARRKEEEEARKQAEVEARRKAKEEARKRAEAEARRKAEEEARKRAEAEAHRKAEEEARKQAEVEARRKAEEEEREREEVEARRKAEEEARKREEAEARRKAEEEARKRAEAEARRKAEEEARKQAEAQRKEEEKKLEEVRKRRLEEEKKIKDARQKIVVAKSEPKSDEINLNNERNQPNETKFEQEEKVAIDKKGILNNMKKYKYAIIGVASIVLLVVAGFAFSDMKNSQTASANNVNSLEVNANLINGLRLSAVQKYQDAALEFDKVDYKKLGKEDKKAVLFTYLLSGKAQKAIDLEQDFAESVVSYYIAVDNLKKVKELKTKNPLINFEIAALDNKHEEVIKLRDQVPLDGRREGIIVNSYLKLNKSEEAKKFAQKVGNKDLLEKINNSTPNSSATSVATISAG
ncbi:cell envelope integrity protein TolA [Bacillus wiedmannii]|uniref:cell envelope integrity protein TolA n=1 Tax=Bacillus wiedmannii TaxID=1890302 RepID=UPI003557EA8F